MKNIKEHARSIHRARHAPLGVRSTSTHAGYAHDGHPHAASRATGGRSGHSDVAEDRALIRGMVKPEALNRARGGSARKKSGGTHVNILVGSPAGAGSPTAAPAGATPAMAPVSAPIVRPTVPAGAASTVPAGIGGVAGPGANVVRKRGGRTGR
jgi:hypothetical protein